MGKKEENKQTCVGISPFSGSLQALNVGDLLSVCFHQQNDISDIPVLFFPFHDHAAVRLPFPNGRKETRRHRKSLLRNQLTAKMKVTSASSLMCDKLFVNVLFFFFVLPAQLSQSHDHSSKSWEFFLGVLKHGAG